MNLVNSITHPNPLTQKKVNYFADYYSLCVRQMGRLQEFEIDNILSLIQKIIAQIENADIEFSQKARYIKSHLTHPFLLTTNKYFKEYKSHYPILSNFFDSYRALKKGETIDEKGLLVLLKKFERHLKKHMFNQALKSIISFLKCEHSIIEHKEDIQHYTKLISVELFFKRKGKADIEQVFDKIITDDIHEFPFCPKFIKSNKAIIQKAKAEFIDKRSFDQQFEGINNFRNQGPLASYYIFRIGNISVDMDLDFEFGNVRFLSSESKRIQSLKTKVDEKHKEYQTPFFLEKFNLFAIVHHKSNSNKNHFAEALEKVKVAVEYLNNECDTSAFLDKHSYLLTKDFRNIGGRMSLGPLERHLRKTHLSKMVKGNVHSYLENKNLQSKKYFLSHEKTYLSAIINSNIDEYWKYAENLLGKPLKSIFVGISSDLVKEMEKQHIEIHIKHCFDRGCGGDPGLIGMTINEQIELIHELFTTENYDYSTLKGKTTNEFIDDLIDIYYKLDKSSNKEYLSRLIEEVYEQRNFIVHNGQDYEKANLKLKESVPFIFFALRRKLLDLMIKDPDKSFLEIRKDLKKQFTQPSNNANR